MMNGERTRLISTPMTNEAQLATTFRTERRQFVKGWTAAADVIMCAAARATRGLPPAGGAPGAGKSARQARLATKPCRATGARSAVQRAGGRWSRAALQCLRQRVQEFGGGQSPCRLAEVSTVGGVLRHHRKDRRAGTREAAARAVDPGRLRCREAEHRLSGEIRSQLGVVGGGR